MFNLSEKSFFKDPYPHMVIENFFVNPDRIIQNFTSESFFLEFKKEFTQASKELLNHLKQDFVNIDVNLPPEIYFRNYSSHAGIRLIRGSHLDSGKVFNSVVYLEEVYSDKNNEQAGSFQIMEDLDDNKPPLKQIDYKFNRAVFFKNTDNSYHRFWSRYPNRMSVSISYGYE